MKKLNLLSLILAICMLLPACKGIQPETDGSPDQSSEATAGITDKLPDFPELVSFDTDSILSLIGTISGGNGLLWYQFEEGRRATKLVSSLPAARDSILLDATLLSDGGVEGGAIEFNGSQKVKLNNQFTEESQITSSTFLHPAFETLSVAFYFMPYSLEGKQIIYEQGEATKGLAIGIENGVLKAAVAAGRGAQTDGKAHIVGEYLLTEDALNQWIHVAVTYDGSERNGTARLYINGSLVATTASIGAIIPQTLDAAGLASSEYGSNALGFTDAYFKGRMDDLRIYSTCIQPMGELEDNVIFLQSAAAKNAYLKASYDQLTVSYNVEPALRGFIITKGAADDQGISLRLTGTDKYITVSNNSISLKAIADDEDKSLATFYQTEALSLPSWGKLDSDAFCSLKTADGQYLTAKNGAVSLSDAASDTDKISATFKLTGDQTNVISQLKGAVYYPTYALNAPQFWKWYDHDIIDRDMSYACSIGINAFRIWVSYEYWLEDSAQFETAFKDFLELAEAHEIVIMVSLFEGCGDSYSYGSANTWNRIYTGETAGWAITSPSAEIYNNKSRWDEPKEFITWFMTRFGNDSRLMAIELYNEPWGAQRAALAKYLCEWAVSIQGSVPLIAGTAPADAFTLDDTIKLGMDILQYHDNFPGSADAFISNANGKIEAARLANLPIYCTEVQWIGGPSGINYPSYAGLAETCNSLMETGKWAPFYWTLMVHPCYLNSYRNNYKMYNGLFYEDGSVYSIKDITAIANTEVNMNEQTVSPYLAGSYRYQYMFSDSFFDRKAYKWTALQGQWSAEDEIYTGSGLTLANNTAFTTFTASFNLQITDGCAGIIFAMKEDQSSYYKAVLNQTRACMEIYQVKSGVSTLLASSSPMEIGSGYLTVTLSVKETEITVTCNCADVTARITAETGSIGFTSDQTAAFDNLHVIAN